MWLTEIGVTYDPTRIRDDLSEAIQLYERSRGRSETTPDIFGGKRLGSGVSGRRDASIRSGGEGTVPGDEPDDGEDSLEDALDADPDQIKSDDPDILSDQERTGEARPSGIDRQATENIRSVVEAANQPGDQKKWTIYAPASEWLRGVARDAGLTLDGFDHGIDADAVRHAKKRAW